MTQPLSYRGQQIMSTSCFRENIAGINTVAV